MKFTITTDDDDDDASDNHYSGVRTCQCNEIYNTTVHSLECYVGSMSQTTRVVDC